MRMRIRMAMSMRTMTMRTAMSIPMVTSNAMSSSRGCPHFPISILLKGFNKCSLET
jgi:hypothetical protein